MDNFDAEIIEWILKGGPQNPEPQGHRFYGDRWVGTRAPANLERIGDAHTNAAEHHQAREKEARAAGDNEKADFHHSQASMHLRSASANYRSAGNAEKAARAGDALASHTVGDFPGHPFRGNQYTKSAEIQKGDLPGHAFRGNQYASLGEKASDLAAAVKKLNSRSTPDEIRSLAKVHQQVATQHFTVSLQSAEMRHLTDPSEIGQKTYDNLVSTSAIEGDKHSDAGYRHSDTADKLYYAAELKEQGSPSASSSILANAKISSANAADASKEAASSGVHWPVGDPEFAQHEEAVAVGKSVDFTKGDLLGHIFHGNQHSKGEGGGKPKPIRQIDTGRFQVEPDRYTLVGPMAREHAKKPTIEGHHDLALLHREAASGLMQMKEGSSEARQSALHDAAKAHADAAEWHEIAAGNYTNGVMNGDANYLKEGSDFASSMSDRADSRTAKVLGIRKELTMTSEIQKGDTPGHEFHGNQWTSGESGKIFDNYRPADINQTISQIGKMNILGISGGRVNPLRNTAGEPVGIHLPVGKGYGVNVLLHPNDTYTVQRVTTRSGVVKIKGQEDGVYAEDLGDTAYRAGMYMNVPFGDHQGTLG